MPRLYIPRSASGRPVAKRCRAKGSALFRDLVALRSRQPARAGVRALAAHLVHIYPAVAGHYAAPPPRGISFVEMVRPKRTYPASDAYVPLMGRG